MFAPHLEFEWDPAKAEKNLRKHGVSFQEATDCFDDPYAVVFSDAENSDDEPREILIGYSGRHRLLFISFIQRAANRVRLISVRRADNQERGNYEKENYSD